MSDLVKRGRELIKQSNKNSLEHCHSDLIHRGFTLNSGDASVVGGSERWTKPINKWDDKDGLWVITITCKAVNGHDLVHTLATKITVEVSEQEHSKTWSLFDSLGHRWS